MTQYSRDNSAAENELWTVNALEQALTNAGICIFYYYPQEKRIFVPERVCQIYGCRSVYTDMPRSFAEEFVHPKYHESFFGIYDAILAGEPTAWGIFSNLDSSIFFQVTLTVSQTDGEGRPLRAVGIIENPTEEILKERQYKEQLQKKNEELQERLVLEQEEMNRRMDAILNGISGGFKISRNDEKFSYVYVSEALAGFLGYTVEEFLQVSRGNVMDFVYPDDVEETYRKEQEDMSKGNTYSCKYRVRCKDGSLKWIVDSGKLVRMADGKEYFYSLYLDVDELERGRLEQAEAAALLKQIVDANACGIFAYTLPERRVLQLNKEAMRLIGWDQDGLGTGEQVYGRTLEKDLVEEDKKKIGLLAQDMRKPGDSFSATYRLQKDGEVYAKVDLESKRLRMPNGQDMILSTLMDVTEKSRMEEKLSESLQSFHIASEEAGNIIVVYDTAARSVRFERKDICPFAEGSPVFGVPHETVNNGTVAEESKAEYLRIHEAMIRGEKAADGVIKRLTLDGQELVYRLRFQTLRDSGGAPTGRAIGVYVDITKEYLHEAEQSFRIEAIRSQVSAIQKDVKKERSRSQEVIRALSDDYFAIYLVDLKKNIMQTIRAQDKLLPHVADQIGQEAPFDKTMRQYIKDHVHPEDKERVARAMVLENIYQHLKRDKVFFLRYRRISGEVCEYTEFKLVDVSEQQDASRSVLAVRSVDSEVRREIEQQETLKEALAQARYASQAKTVFLSNMSHDIRTPMNAIVGFSNIAASHMDDRERVRDCVAKILAASSHLESLINDILDMSRIESGKLVIRENESSIPELMSSLMSVIQPQIQTKRLRFSARTFDIRNETVRTDALKLRQVLINILGNAVKFTPPGGKIRFTIRQSPSAVEGCGRYSFIISDTGIGMSREFQKHIFEPFERETTSTLGQTEGTGLGMSITKSILDAMGGTVSVESRQGKGSVFKVELDLRTVEEQPEGDIRHLAGRRALVVSAEAVAGDGVELLERVPLRAERASSAQEALRLTREADQAGDRYDVYLIDQALPDMDGQELAHRILAAAGDHPPVVILADYDWPDLDRERQGDDKVERCGKPLFLSSLIRAMLRATSAQPQEEPPELDFSKFNGIRILLVEDNQFNREIAEEILSDRGFLVESAVDGEDALRKLEATSPGYFNVVLMDIQMPVMNGYEAARAIRAMEREDLARLPIIAMTANAFEEDKEEALRSGMNDHLSKPVDVDRMLQKISRLL